MQTEDKKHKWSMVLNVEISQVELNNAFNNIWRITNNSKLRSFQYLILHHAIVTNRNLYHYGMLDYDICSLCDDEAESIVHLFCECYLVQEFYIDVKLLIKEQMDFVEIKQNWDKKI